MTGRSFTVSLDVDDAIEVLYALRAVADQTGDADVRAALRDVSAQLAAQGAYAEILAFVLNPEKT